ncbi:MAG: hypothetical protein JWM57_3907 [Phycisphaerales bacterium]|nr:hypothetical protein [Phycisphaerales bacterium]
MRLLRFASLVSAAIIGLSAAPSPARVLNWSGYNWDVRDAAGAGPGPNNYSDSTSNLYVDAAGLLHLKIIKLGSQWYCASISAQNSLGYGTYAFQLNSNTENLDKNVVAGLFTYASDTQEIDVELSRWGVAGNQDAQFAVQPTATSGNLRRFNLSQQGDYTTHLFDWEKSSITFQSIYGHYDSSPPGTAIQNWTYTGKNIPAAGSEKPYINLWLYQGNAQQRANAGTDSELVYIYAIDDNTCARAGIGRPASARRLAIAAFPKALKPCPRPAASPHRLIPEPVHA